MNRRMSTPAAPELRYSFRIVAHVDPYLTLQDRGGDRLEYIPITGGPVSGELRGAIIPGGADWCVIRADDTFEVEARMRTAPGSAPSRSPGISNPGRITSSCTSTSRATRSRTCGSMCGRTRCRV